MEMLVFKYYLFCVLVLGCNRLVDSCCRVSIHFVGPRLHLDTLPGIKELPQCLRCPSPRKRHQIQP